MAQHFGKYELIKRVGRGGMAEVWKALDTQLNRYVAIKFLHPDLRTDPSFVMRFVREAQAIAALHHPNIVKIHDFQITNASDSDDSIAYMVMNFIEGPMLSEYIARTSRLGKYPPPTDILNLFVSIGRAIDYAHQQGMIHRDIKPTNILLDERDALRHPMGNPILTDFGIVKLMGTAGSTLSGMMVGTPSYISPEQALGKPGNERSDIYSFGVILYEICTGVRPFQGDSAAAIIMQHISAAPTPPHLINPNLPSAATDVILRCLAKLPGERFPNAASMTSALAQALNLSLSPGSSGPNSYVVDTGNGPGSANLGPQNFPFTPVAGPQMVPGMLPTDIQGSRSPGPHTPIPQPNSFSPKASTPNQDIPGLETPAQPRLSPALTPVFSESGQHVLAMGSRPASPMAPTGPISPKKRRNLLIASTVLLILVLLAAGLSTLYLLTHNQPSGTAPIVNSSVGTATFISSATVSAATSRGLEDELRITLHNIAAPAAGKSYYAWLLSDTNVQPVQAISLGNLSVINGNVNFIYPHDQQDANLLCASSRFVITEQDASQTPGSFPSDTSTWRYYAELPQKSDNSVNPTGVLTDLRVLLCERYFMSGTPPAQVGDVFGLIQSAQQVRTLVDASRSASDNKAARIIHDEVVRILDYLDGAQFVKIDIPTGPSLLVDQKLVQLPLIDVSPGQTPASYTTFTSTTLQSLIIDPGVTSNMLTLSNQALNALADAQGNLEQVRTDAKQLVIMNDAQLLQPATRDLLNSMFASYEQADSATDGIVFIGDTIQRLPTFDIKPYKP